MPTKTLAPKRWIVKSTGGGLRLLQMVSDIEGCANEDADPKWWIVRTMGEGN